MSYKTILTSLESGIYTLTINRPEKMNALNQTVMDELSLAVQEVYENEAIRSVLLTGAGEKAFVAGADIGEFLKFSSSEGMALAEKGHRIFSRIENSPKPFIAAVNGFALGGGCELAMACHFRIASENAKFGQPEVNLGLIPGYGGTQRLTRLIGKGPAMELMMTGDMISAEEAWRLGLVNRVVAPEKLLDEGIQTLMRIQAKSPLAISKLITSINAATEAEKGFETEIREFGSCFNTEDMKEGVQAFLEKRKPAFKGK